jgi:tetratricopeptide (TPR) repeat protein
VFAPFALALVLIATVPLAAQDVDADADRERHRLEDLLYSGRRAEAAAGAERLMRDPTAPSSLRRVGAMIRCEVLLGNFRLARSDPRLADAAARQAERALRQFLRKRGSGLVDLKARFLLGLFYQERARWRFELNDVLYAAEIGEDLTASSRAFKVVIDRVPPDEDNVELAGYRTWSRVYRSINFYLFARLYAPGNLKREANLDLALKSLFQLAREFPGLPAGNYAYFYHGHALELYGAVENAREVFLDLWRAVPWDTSSAPLLEEVLWNLCRIDAARGRPSRVIAAVSLLRKRIEPTARVPSRYVVMACGEAAVAQLQVHGPRDAAHAFEEMAAWLDRRSARSAVFRLPRYAARLAPAVRSRVKPQSHPRFILMAARGFVRRGEPVRALEWTALLNRTRCRIGAAFRRDALEIASRAWELRGYLREAIVAHRLSIETLPHADAEARLEAQRRTAALWGRLARRTGSALDRKRYAAARAAVPRPAGEMEYEAGWRAYKNGSFTEALEWLAKVDDRSPLWPIALALRAHIRYRTLPPTAAARSELERILRMLERLDNMRPRARNWMPAQSLRYLTQAMVKRALGDLDGAVADLRGYEDQFASQPHLVTEALKARVAVHLERGDEDAARAALTVLRERFPEHRALGEAALILGRHLRARAYGDRSTGRSTEIDRGRLEESVRHRRHALQILGAAFNDRHRYLLAIDEMALDHPGRALVILDDLKRRRSKVLREVEDGLELRRVRCLMRLGELEKAAAVLIQVIQRKPNYLAPLELQAVLLGGTLVRRDGNLIERRYLGRSGEAFVVWERIKNHAERTTPYRALWFEVQFHLALLNYWERNLERVRAILEWIEASDYSPFSGHPEADRFRWLAERVGYPVPDESTTDEQAEKPAATIR